MASQWFRWAKSPTRITLATVAALIAARILASSPAMGARPCPTCHPKGIVVDTLVDDSVAGDGLCSLREAIDNTNSKSDTTDGDCSPGIGKDKIVFSVSGTIAIASMLPAIANTSGNSLVIDGSGQTITISGADEFQVLSVNQGATLSLNNLTIANGYSIGSAGGIANGGTLTVTNCTISGNRTEYDGGAIDNAGTASVINSTLSGNSADNMGGGIINVGNLTVINSTFSGNAAGFSGGGIEHQAVSTTLIITNSTFSGNIANARGGGIESVGCNENCVSGLVTISNSILSSNSSGNCAVHESPITNGGYNISDDDTCGFGTSTGANGETIGVNVDPMLDPNGLQNNGGPTETIALEPNSPAIGAVPLANCTVNTDQRGDPRPNPERSGTACDIGAFEYQGVLPTPTPTPTSTPTPTTTPTPIPTATPSGLVTVTPTSLHFGTVVAGHRSVPQVVALSNGTAKKVAIRGTTIGGDFKILLSTCSSPLSPGASCGYSISFEPRGAGTKKESFTVTAGGTHKVTLSGIATAQ
jgi:CSLREA domain-containing protein